MSLYQNLCVLLGLCACCFLGLETSSRLLTQPSVSSFLGTRASPHWRSWSPGHLREPLRAAQVPRPLPSSVLTPGSRLSVFPRPLSVLVPALGQQKQGCTRGSLREESLSGRAAAPGPLWTLDLHSLGSGPHRTTVKNHRKWLVAQENLGGNPGVSPFPWGRKGPPGCGVKSRGFARPEWGGEPLTSGTRFVSKAERRETNWGGGLLHVPQEEDK